MLKRVDNAVYDAMMDAKNGEWSAGIQVMGLAENGVGYALDENNEALLTAGDDRRGRRGRAPRSSRARSRCTTTRPTSACPVS